MMYSLQKKMDKSRPVRTQRRLFSLQGARSKEERRWIVGAGRDGEASLERSPTTARRRRSVARCCWSAVMSRNGDVSSEYGHVRHLRGRVRAWAWL